MVPEAFLTSSEVAQLLRVHPKQIYRLLKKGLPARRVGSEWRFVRSDVLAWSGGGEREPEPAEMPRLGEFAPPPIVAVNGDVAVVVLLQLMGERGPPLLGWVQSDTGAGLTLLGQGAVLATGAHAGGFPTHVGKERAARIHLVKREIGLLTRPDGRPIHLGDLARHRLASRPPTAGSRRHLDAALRAEGLDPEKAHRHALLLGSHLDVVLAVAAGRADVGIASRAWGERAGLVFQPLVVEAYGLIVRASALGDARVIRVCEVAQSKAYRSAIGTIPGYDAHEAGDIRYDA
jgi:excisionase family DNA binding protein